MKRNIEYWNELETNGWLYSYIKDGKPEAIEKIIGYSYPITMIIIIAIIAFQLSKRTISLKKLGMAILGPTLLGWIWGGWILQVDEIHPAWLFPPWSVTNIEYIMSLEDWLWYPACTAICFFLYKSINFTDFSKYRNFFLVTIIIFYVFYILFFILYTQTCGLSITYFFTIPGTLIFIYLRDVIEVKRFLVFMMVLVVINLLWDWTATYWIHSNDGMAWASQWIYISFNEAGDAIHSNVYLDYKQHSWAWFFDSPIEITPAFAISGSILAFSFFTLIESLFSSFEKKNG